MKITIAILLALSACLITGCQVNQDDFTRIMRQEGVTNAVDEGYAFWGCDDSDTFHTSFSGIKNGQPVSGVLCGGFLKDYTIRFK